MQLSIKSEDIRSDEDGTDNTLQYFVSSAAANTPLMGPLLAGQPAGVSLEMTAVGDGDVLSCNAVMDFTSAVSPSKVNNVSLNNAEGMWVKVIIFTTT